jgi:Secretion system C-terminal sorting domain
MKRVYFSLLAICICMMASYPRIAFAQCTCSGGVPATAIVYNVALPVSSAPTSTVSFPQFNPAIGSLSCLTLQDTMTGVSTTHVQNTGPVKTKFQFLLTVANDIEGPPGGGFTEIDPFVKPYGPDSLDMFGTVGDSITYGPDTVFNHNIDHSSTTNTAPYLGLGTVNFTYTINGGLTSLQGGLNYNDQITTTYWGDFTLTYYWCPAVVLATNIVDFTAGPNGNALLFQWTTANELNNTSYEIQISTDGKQFTGIGQTESDPATTGSTAKYQYQYHPNQAALGNLYFRIQQTEADGKISYSKVIVVSPGGTNGAPISYQTFPNPATNSLIFQFNNNQTGRYMLELVNTAGQVILQKPMTLTGTSQITLDLSPRPVKGLYYLRTRDLTHNQEYVSKVLIN